MWTLRRYRDNMLARMWYGRLFIHSYYTISPTLVRLLGNTKLFQNLLIKPLNRWGEKLNKEGFASTPY